MLVSICRTGRSVLHYLLPTTFRVSNVRLNCPRYEISVAALERGLEEVTAMGIGRKDRPDVCDVSTPTFEELSGNFCALVERRNGESGSRGIDTGYGSGEGGAAGAVVNGVSGATADTGRACMTVGLTKRLASGASSAVPTVVRVRSVDLDCTVIAVDERAQDEFDSRAGFLSLFRVGVSACMQGPRRNSHVRGKPAR